MQLITINIVEDGDIARVRQVGIALTRALGFGTFDQTRIVTACLELARNAVQYGGGGRMTFALCEGEDELLLQATASDQGPGIEDLDTILHAEPGRRRSPGGGLGLGLRGVQRVADALDIDTGAEGSRLQASFTLPFSEAGIKKAGALATDALAALGETDPAAELAQQNKQLLQALAERDVLIGEIHHRTSNNLALITGLIQLSRRAAKEEETVRALSELEGRVHAVTKVHEQLQRADQGDRLRVLPFLHDVAAHIEQAFNGPDRAVNIRVSGDDLEIESAAAVDIGLIVGELITNAYKHAFGSGGGEIAVSFERHTDDELLLCVKDNGRGLSEGTERPERSDSLGWRMIRTMVQRHGGTIEVNGNGGLRVDVRLSISILADDAPGGSERTAS